MAISEITQRIFAKLEPAFKHVARPASPEAAVKAIATADELALKGANRSAVSKLIAFNQHVLEANPKRLTMKYRNMAISPRRFFTGQPELYTYDMRGLFKVDLPAAPLDGDLHLNQNGAMQLVSGKLKVRLNDFDLAYIGPVNFDLNRMGTHIMLTARENGLSEKQARALVKAYADAYYRTLGRIEDGVAHPGPQPPKAVKAMLAAGRKRDYAKWLDHQAPETHGQRAFKLRSDRKAVSPTTLADLKQGFEGYRAALSPEAARSLEGYKVTDAIAVYTGTGGIGESHYRLLLEAPGKRDPIILQLKEEPEAPMAPYAGHYAFSSQGERNLALSDLMDDGLDPLRGAARLPMRSSTSTGEYIVSRENPAEGFINAGNMKKPADLQALVEFYAGRHAIAHASGAQVGLASAADLQASLGDREGFTRNLADFASGYADKVERDFREFKQAYKQDGLLGARPHAAAGKAAKQATAGKSKA